MIVQGVEVCYTPVLVDVRPLTALAALQNHFLKERGLPGHTNEASDWGGCIQTSTRIDDKGQWVTREVGDYHFPRTPVRPATEEEIKTWEAFKTVENFITKALCPERFT